MKILIAIPTNQSSKDFDIFNDGIKLLKKIGHNISDTSSISKNEKELEKNFSKTDKLIKETDILIAEVSQADSKVGYEIARALDEKKVVIAFESDKSKQTLPIIHGNNTKQLIVKKYSKNNIERVIEESLKEAEGRLDSKFILIISPEMDRYLNWASKAKRTHKAQIVRAAVEQMMKKDKEYREYNEE